MSPVVEQDGNGTPAAQTVRVVLMTAPDQEVGLSLIRNLVGARLAACGNLVPGITSLYWWEGNIQQDDETLIILKTTEEVLPELKKRVLELHPYEVPEFLALSIDDGHLPYLRWVLGEVTNQERS